MWPIERETATGAKIQPVGVIHAGKETALILKRLFNNLQEAVTFVTFDSDRQNVKPFIKKKVYAKLHFFASNAEK